MSNRLPNKKLEELVALIFATHRAIRDKVEDGDEIDPFTILRLEALRFVAMVKRPTMKDIAANLRITAPSVSVLVTGLAKSGYVRRMESAADRRLTHIAITAKGRKFLSEGFAKVERSMRSTLSRLEERDIDELMKTLRRIADVYGDKRS